MRQERTIVSSLRVSLRALLSVALTLVLGILLSGMPVILGTATPVWGQSVEVAALPKIKALDVPIDVNNTILRNYRQLPGFYPTLARVLVQNAPYDSLEDILTIPNLNDRQKELIKANAQNFMFGDYQEGRYQLESRINQGYYG